MEPAHLLGTGGAIGAACRYAIGLRLAHDRFPLATFVVNVLGSFVLGLLVFLDVGGDALLFLGVGVCGSFTTYSSFSFQAFRLWETGERLRAGIYAVGTLVACLLAVAVAGLLAALI